MAYLAGVFGDGVEVAYPKFLSWATPGPDGLAASGTPASARSCADHDHRPQGANVGPTSDASRDSGRVVERGRPSAVAGRGRDSLRGNDDIFEEDEAELKVCTALRRMGDTGIQRAWDEFGRVDPGGTKGTVREHELVEVRKVDGVERQGKRR